MQAWLSKSDIDHDFTDVLYDLLCRACAVGMLPNDFWEHTPADIIDYIGARERYNSQISYMQAGMTAAFLATHISNAFSTTKHQIPSYEDLFEPEDDGKSDFEKRIEQLKSKFGGIIAKRGVRHDNG